VCRRISKNIVAFKFDSEARKCGVARIEKSPVLGEEGEGMKSAQCAGKRHDGKTRRDIEGGIVSAGDGMREERKI
jgi:hypothetical protein